MFSFLLALVLCLLSAGYVYLRWIYGHWTRQGVPHEEPHLFWGSLQGVGKQFSLGDKVKSTYLKFRGHSKVCGMFMMTRRLAVICDLDLVKTVLIRDFHKFSDRGMYFNERDDPLSANIFTLPEERWKLLRSKLSPAFSTGKLRAMTPIVAQLGEKLLSKLQESGCGESVNAGNLFARYTTDVIGNCAFGLDCNSLDDPGSEFLEKGNMVFRPATSNAFRRVFALGFGSLSRKLGIKNTPSEANTFFYTVARQSVEYREKGKGQRDDFLSSLLQMKANSELTFDEVAAQMFLFQLAGYETSSTTLTYCAYELVMNPDVQERLREEVQVKTRQHNGELTYEAIFDMPYMDCVINEALRKYPPGRMLIRRVTVDRYELPGAGVQLTRDDLVAVSVTGIQHDPQIYPDPKKFDPDRFLPQNVQQRHSMSFLAFGEGNRNCLGMRFAMMEIKMALAKVLLKFRLVRGKDLPDELEFLPKGIILTPACDINVVFTDL